MSDYMNIVPGIVSTHSPTSVKPGEFFVSWNGVPTLAYKGFSPTLLAIKKEIEQRLLGIKKENPGARWPKTTLGALRDDRTLSMGDAETLRQICTKFNDTIPDTSFPISELSLVVFRCRSLEDRLLTHTIALAGSGTEPSMEECLKKHEQEVADIMDQFSSARLVEYFPKLQEPGNRESHYRYTHVEATLVFDLPRKFIDFVSEFIHAVDKALPGYYCWFKEESRHMTVRGLA